MTRMYYRGAAACILCYDLTDRTSFDRVRFWAGELKATEQVPGISLEIFYKGAEKLVLTLKFGQRASWNYEDIGHLGFDIILSQS